MQLIQTALAAIYPPRCLGCGGLVEQDFGLCAACWADTTFVGRTACDSCGTPLPGVSDGTALTCDGCIAAPKPWDHGRAALIYEGIGRKLVLQLKHADRQEIAAPAAQWMQRVCADILTPDTLIAPVPLHWTRLAKRRYNLSALLASALARVTGRDWCPDLLLRARRTDSLDGKSREERAETVRGAIVLNPRRRHRVVGRPVLIVDDVLTTGATLSVCAEACRAAGAGPVCIAVLARVGKDA